MPKVASSCWKCICQCQTHLHFHGCISSATGICQANNIKFQTCVCYEGQILGDSYTFHKVSDNINENEVNRFIGPTVNLHSPRTNAVEANLCPCGHTNISVWKEPVIMAIKLAPLTDITNKLICILMQARINTLSL